LFHRLPAKVRPLFGCHRGRLFSFQGESTVHESVIDLIEQVLGWDIPETAITDALHFRVPELAGWQSVA
jgi:hypothetical protein